MLYKEQELNLIRFQKEMKNLLSKKGHDYSNKDSLSNFKSTAEIINSTPEKVILTMMGIKMARLGVLLSENKEPKNESILDSIIDLANYTFLLDCSLRDKVK